MKIPLTTFAALLCLVGGLSAQGPKKSVEKCKIKVENAPKPGGYYLRQELVDVVEKSLAQRLEVPEISVSGPMVLIRGVFDPKIATQRDSAYSVSWSFSNDKVATLRLQYLAYTPTDLAKFIEDYSLAANLPKGIFKVTSEYKAEAKCDGFSIYLTSAHLIDQQTRQMAEVRIVDRKAGQVNDRSAFEDRVQGAKRQSEELRRNPRKIINPGGPVVGRSN
jgi:hypothetical protein